MIEIAQIELLYFVWTLREALKNFSSLFFHRNELLYRVTTKVWDKQIRSLLTYSWSHKKVLAICVICRFWGFQNTKKHLCTMKIMALPTSKSCESKTRLHATSIWQQFCYNIATSTSPMSSKLCGYMFVIKVWQCVMILVVKLWKSTHFMHKKCHLWQLLLFFGFVSKLKSVLVLSA